jgi:hypothetical protein
MRNDGGHSCPERTLLKRIPHFALALTLLLAAATAQAAPLSPGQPVKGEILETRDVDSYTYLRLKTADGEIWAAVPTTAVKKGAQVTIANPMTMENFESKALKKKFDRIVFGQLAEPGAATAPTAPTASPHGAKPATAGAGTVAKVAKASGPEGRTVAEIVNGKAGLKDKTVLVRGQVVKVNLGIMGKNWIHLQDGSGAAADGSNDILVTTQDKAALGDIVSAKGTVRTDVNVGPGYAYAVMIENATVGK